MSTHTYRTMDVPVVGGDLRVGVWDPVGAEGVVPSVLAIHGVTSSHLAWPFVVDELAGIRVIAPDLRGRGASRGLLGEAGMAAHAADLVAVLDDLGLDRVPVVGHSMGAFVAVVLADLYPDRVSRLVLVDGGLPLNVPAGLAPEKLVSLILGSTAERLSRRWESVAQYTDEFWRSHPAFVDHWSAALEAYIAYDLVADGDAFVPATSYQTTVEDTIDMNTGTALPQSLAHLSVPTLFLTVPRGLQNDAPGLYSDEHRERVLQDFPGITHVPLDDLNHYTVVMSERGAAALAPYLRSEIAAGS